MLRTLILTALLLPAAAFARDWQVDAAKSSLTFKGSYQGEAFDGQFKKFDATIAYDAADLSKSKFDVAIDLASADTANSDRDDSLHGSDFFDVKKTPKAHFVTDSFSKAADGSVEAKGKLTIRDKTQPVTLKVKFFESGDMAQTNPSDPNLKSGSAATLDVDTVLKRADFGLGAGKDWSDVGADVPVHGHLTLLAK